MSLVRRPHAGGGPILLSLVLLLVAACGGGGGGGSSNPVLPPTTATYTDNTVYSSAAGASLSAPNEITAVTRHQLGVGGQTLAYTATVGHLTARQLGTGNARASFFYVAYTLDGAAPASRPVTFFYNGGPGSASVWLHIGSFGPRRVATGVPATNVPTPFEMVDNAESLLDVSDLVFVDAVGSGYSQAVSPSTNRDYWGVDDDAEVFRDFVMRYAIVNNRGSSPKFLYGESYGGPRTGVLADLLEAAGVRLHGVVLQSPAMNYNTNCDITTSPARPCGGFIPSYGASGAWFNRSTPSPPAAQLAPYMAQMRTLAGRYDVAVRSFLTNITPLDPALVTDLANGTGIGESHWRSRFNMGPSYYRVNLIPGTLLGRYDTRITLPNETNNPDLDPSSVLISTSFGFRITEYLTSLGYTNPSTYTMLSNAIQTWRFSHDGNGLPDTIPDLAAAIAQNPRLKVLAVNGYHDVATPFFTTEADLARLGTNPNVQVRNYVGGHMTYLDDASRVQMKADLAEWYRSALAN
jgi:carboxypeptidase C (cathepsin A)